ncbi:hypothetical protein GCM10009565_53050 [Amycolatopsis albidoflavus]
MRLQLGGIEDPGRRPVFAIRALFLNVVVARFRIAEVERVVLVPVEQSPDILGGIHHRRVHRNRVRPHVVHAALHRAVRMVEQVVQHRLECLVQPGQPHFFRHRQRPALVAHVHMPATLDAGHHFPGVARAVSENLQDLLDLPPDPDVPTRAQDR